MGQEEYALGREVDAFDDVKDILPERSELDAAEPESSKAAQSLRQLEDRIGYNFVNRDILVDPSFRGQPALNVDLNELPLVRTRLRTQQFMYLIFKRLEEE